MNYLQKSASTSLCSKLHAGVTTLPRFCFHAHTYTKYVQQTQCIYWRAFRLGIRKNRQIEDQRKKKKSKRALQSAKFHSNLPVFLFTTKNMLLCVELRHGLYMAYDDQINRTFRYSRNKNKRIARQYAEIYLYLLRDITGLLARVYKLDRKRIPNHPNSIWNKHPIGEWRRITLKLQRSSKRSRYSYNSSCF